MFQFDGAIMRRRRGQLHQLSHYLNGYPVNKDVGSRLWEMEVQSTGLVCVHYNVVCALQRKALVVQIDINYQPQV